MKKIKVLLSDPRHDTVGTHSNYVPMYVFVILMWVYTRCYTIIHCK